MIEIRLPKDTSVFKYGYFYPAIPPNSLFRGIIRGRTLGAVGPYDNPVGAPDTFDDKVIGYGGGALPGQFFAAGGGSRKGGMTGYFNVAAGIASQYFGNSVKFDQLRRH